MCLCFQRTSRLNKKGAAPKNTRVRQTNLDLRQLENLGERADAVGVGGERVQTLAAEDGGGHGPQSVAAQVQLLQLLQPSQFTAGGGWRYGYIRALTRQTLFLGNCIRQTHLSGDLNRILKRGSEMIMHRVSDSSEECELMKARAIRWTKLGDALQPGQPQEASDLSGIQEPKAPLRASV